MSSAWESFMARVVAVLILFLAFYGTATADDLSTSADGSGDVAVAACTRALETGSLNRTDRVRAYNTAGSFGSGKAITIAPLLISQQQFASIQNTRRRIPIAASPT
jgi:hypothetical protein